MKAVSTSFKGLTRTLLLMFTFASAGFLVACSDSEGPAEKAGKQIDNAIDSAAEVLDPKGPAEKVGEAIDDAVEQAGDKIDEWTSEPDAE